MRPCPSCAWMLKDTDSACTMCGLAVVGAAPAQPPPPPYAPPPMQGGAGAYAPPGPPGYVASPPPGGYGGAAPPAPIASGYGAPVGAQGVYPPPPAPSGMNYGGGAPPPAMNYGGGAPPPPAAAGGSAAFTTGADMPFPVSPWARAAVVAPSPSGYPLQTGGQGLPMPPAMAAPIPVMPNAAMGVPAMTGLGAPVPPPVGPMFGAPPAAMVAPPALVTGGAVGAPARPVPLTEPVAPPGMVAPPPFVQFPAMASAPQAAMQPPQQQPQASGGRVLVGFLITFQSDPGGSFWPIYSGRMQMGRALPDGTTDVALSDASASSRHASVHADPITGQAYIEDDGSRNGTFLNEQRLQQGERRQLRDNDRLRLGGTAIVVKLLVS